MKITYLIRTNALDSDERFSKTCLFLEEIGEELDVFAVVKRLSIVRRGKCTQDTLVFRRFLKSGSWVILKYIEIVLRAGFFLLYHRGRRWYANFDFLPLHLLSALISKRDMRPIWDLHEMPPEFVMDYTILRRLFGWLLTRSHVIVCNEARLKALEKLFRVDLSNALVMRNYPSRSAANLIKKSRKAYLDRLASDEDCFRIVIVGGDVPGRYVPECVEVVEDLRNETGLPLRVSIIGGNPLTSDSGFVTSTGFVSFQELIQKCVEGGISLCFYRTASLNNSLCEPNRFYQAIVAGQRILTFNHESLRSLKYPLHYIVKENDFAVSLRAVLLPLLYDTENSLKQQSEAVTNFSQDFVFENQLPAFTHWYRDCGNVSSNSFD